MQGWSASARSTRGIAQLVEVEIREAATATTFRETAAATETVAHGDGVRNEPNPVYRRDRLDTSYFKDLAAATLLWFR